jgi:hypothetical protein
MCSIGSRWGKASVAFSCAQSSTSCTLYSMVWSCMPSNHSSYSSIPRNSKCLTKWQYHLMLHAVKSADCLSPTPIPLVAKPIYHWFYALSNQVLYFWLPHL